MYRERRDTFAQVAQNYRQGEQIPQIKYTQHEVCAHARVRTQNNKLT